MKSSLSNASAVFKGLKGWWSRSAETVATDVEAQNRVGVAWECGEPHASEHREEMRDRWPLGPGVDNFS